MTISLIVKTEFFNRIGQKQPLTSIRASMSDMSSSRHSPGHAVSKRQYRATGLTPDSDVTRRSVAVHRRPSHILIDDLGAIDLTEHLAAVTEDQANIYVSLDHDVALDD